VTRKTIRVLSVFGTRPEATKMAPVVWALDRDPVIESVVAVTGQHRQQLDAALSDLGIVPQFDLDLMQADQALTGLLSAVIGAVGELLRRVRPDFVLVHGDTSTTVGATLAAFYERVPVGHVEAGLRSGSLTHPFPEEGNRRVVDAVCDLLFAPTEGAAAHLSREGYEEHKILVTGNTAVDTLLLCRDRAQARPLPCLEGLDAKRLIVVTAHRRESFGGAFQEMCKGLLEIAERNSDVQIIYPVHLNPNVRKPVFEILGKSDRIQLIEPLTYLEFVHLMDRSYFILTDSGGLQEEAPALQKPVLVMRERTERPEAVDAGTAILVGTSCARIAAEAQRLLDDSEHYDRMARAKNPFGDGEASSRIVAAVRNFFNLPATIQPFAATAPR
jgi:UDP-N-acetylglucosamine 2-epimerase (non-hydrolysing)